MSKYVTFGERNTNKYGKNTFFNVKRKNILEQICCKMYMEITKLCKYLSDVFLFWFLFLVEKQFENNAYDIKLTKNNIAKQCAKVCYIKAHFDDSLG